MIRIPFANDNEICIEKKRNSLWWSIIFFWPLLLSINQKKTKKTIWKIFFFFDYQLIISISTFVIIINQSINQYTKYAITLSFHLEFLFFLGINEIDEKIKFSHQIFFSFIIHEKKPTKKTKKPVF